MRDRPHARRRGDGRAPQDACRSRRTVPPRIGADPARAHRHRELPGDGGGAAVITDAIRALVEGHDLSAEEAHIAMMQVMSGDASPAQIAAFMVALRVKGETPDEIAGCARAMRAHVTPARPSRTDLVDTCGTGGDGMNTFNISTSAALVAAGRGRHGGQARQPGDLVQDGVGRRARGPRRAHRPRPAGRGGVHRHGRVRVPVRPGPPPGHAPRRGGAARARHPLGVQPARAADQPGRRPAAGGRRVLGEPGRADRPRAGQARHRARDGRARRGRPGRAHPDRREPGVRGARRRGAHLHARPAAALDRRGARAAPTTSAAAATRPRTPR